MNRNLIDFDSDDDDVASVAGSLASSGLGEGVAVTPPTPPPAAVYQPPAAVVYQPPAFSYFPPPPAVNVHMKLSEYWVDAPVVWFGTAEAQFMSRGVHDELQRFWAVTAALPREAAKPVSHLLAAPDAHHPYTTLKAALLAAHQLTPFQRMERLMAMPAMGDKTPSQLLQEMFEFCPTPEQAGKELFAFLFLHRLPRELRVLLAHESHEDLRQLAAVADEKLAFHSQQAHEGGMAAVVNDPSMDPIAAIGAAAGPHRQKKKGKASLPPPITPTVVKRTPAVLTTAAAARDPDKAEFYSGLCWFHWTHGNKAVKCVEGCLRQGN